MLVMALDTSTMVTSVAVLEDEKIIADFNINQQKTHSESLMPMIEITLKFLGLRIKDIDLFVVCEGPGSFTGLRISMTALKTLAQVYNKPLVSVSSLKALSMNVFSKEYTISLIDARARRVYAAMYEGYDKKEIIKGDLYEVDEFARLCNKFKGEKILVGEVSEKYKDLFEDATVSGFSYDNMFARQLLKLGVNEKNYKNIFEITPNYMRKSQAERDREK